MERLTNHRSMAYSIANADSLKEEQMGQKIVIALDEQISCPKCQNHFALRDGITHQTIERYESELQQTLAESRKEIEDRAERSAEVRAVSRYESEIKRLSEQVTEQSKAVQEARTAVTKARIDERRKSLEDFNLEKGALAEELAQKDAKLKEFRQMELQLRAEKN